MRASGLILCIGIGLLPQIDQSDATDKYPLPESSLRDINPHATWNRWLGILKSQRGTLYQNFLWYAIISAVAFAMKLVSPKIADNIVAIQSKTLSRYISTYSPSPNDKRSLD
ncbi:MAG: hypothetical protein WC227_02760 [Patescibacteria group bacterium]|jgi:hypothetical protein